MKLSVLLAKKLLENAGYKLTLSDDKDIFAEMTFDKRDIQFEFKNKFSQIYQNWCLLTYVKETQNKLETANHWAEELLTHLMSISSMKLIKGNNRKKVLDALNEMYYVKMEFHTEDLNSKCRLYKKFNDENIKYELSHLENAFKLNVDILIKLIAYSTDQELETYCFNFWKNE